MVMALETGTMGMTEEYFQIPKAKCRKAARGSTLVVKIASLSSYRVGVLYSLCSETLSAMYVKPQVAAATK